MYTDYDTINCYKVLIHVTPQVITTEARGNEGSNIVADKTQYNNVAEILSIKNSPPAAADSRIISPATKKRELGKNEPLMERREKNEDINFWGT